MITADTSNVERGSFEPCDYIIFGGGFIAALPALQEMVHAGASLDADDAAASLS